MGASAHGFLGFAAITAPTLRDALESAARYVPTRLPVLTLTYRADARECTIFLDELVALEDTAETILLSLVVSLWSMGEALTGQKLTGHVEFFAMVCFEDRGRMAVVWPFTWLAAMCVALLYGTSVVHERIIGRH